MLCLHFMLLGNLDQAILKPCSDFQSQCKVPWERLGTMLKFKVLINAKRVLLMAV